MHGESPLAIGGVAMIDGVRLFACVALAFVVRIDGGLCQRFGKMALGWTTICRIRTNAFASVSEQRKDAPIRARQSVRSLHHIRNNENW